jgi:hypothetical protein
VAGVVVAAAAGTGLTLQSSCGTGVSWRGVHSGTTVRGRSERRWQLLGVMWSSCRLSCLLWWQRGVWWLGRMQQQYACAGLDCTALEAAWVWLRLSTCMRFLAAFCSCADTTTSAGTHDCSCCPLVHAASPCPRKPHCCLSALCLLSAPMSACRRLAQRLAAALQAKDESAALELLAEGASCSTRLGWVRDPDSGGYPSHIAAWHGLGGFLSKLVESQGVWGGWDCVGVGADGRVVWDWSLGDRRLLWGLWGLGIV